MSDENQKTDVITKEKEEEYSKPHNPEALASEKEKDVGTAKTEQSNENATEDDVEPIIKAKDLDFIYNPGRNNEFHALRNISIDIYPDEFVIIFGPSGCGKSTLLNVIAGLETPDSGEIRVLDKDLTKMKSREFAMYHRKQIGMIYQAYNLITSLTVLENVALPQIFVNVRKRRRERWSKQLLERFDILEHAKKIPTELSGGQQQRIGIARAIVNNPQIVLADEPVGNLDSSSAKLVLDILEELNKKEHKTIIMVTHNPEYLDFADRILYMKDGEITKEIVNKEKHKKKKKKIQTVAGEINELMRAYQGMSAEQINILIMPFKSKIFANHFLSSRNMEETKVFEEAIQKRLLGSIKESEFFDVLNKPTDEGGVGFDKRTAEKIVKRINRVVRMAFYIYQNYRQEKNELGEHIEITFEEKARKMRDYLYKTCYYEHYKDLSEEQNLRIDEAIRERLSSEIDRVSFQRYLDKPFKEGGVGLNYKTAKSISEELELILIIGFGVVSASQREAKKRKEAEEKERRKEEMARKKYEREHPEEVKKVSTPSPGEILNQMEAQLDVNVSTVKDIEKHDVDNHVLKEIHGDKYKENHKKQIQESGPSEDENTVTDIEDDYKAKKEQHEKNYPSTEQSSEEKDEKKEGGTEDIDFANASLVEVAKFINAKAKEERENNKQE